MDLRERSGGNFVRHPWETARSHFFGELVRRVGNGRPPAHILDVGAGDTWLASQLAERCPTTRVACWDSSYTPELLAELSPLSPFSRSRPLRYASSSSSLKISMGS